MIRPCLYCRDPDGSMLPDMCLACAERRRAWLAAQPETTFAEGLARLRELTKDCAWEPAPPDLPAVLAAFEAEATEREARAANPAVVGVVERDVEEMAVRTLRRVVAAVRDAW